MKKYFSILALCFLATVTFGQGVVKKLSDKTCKCMEKEDLDAMSSEDLQMKFGLCMVEHAMEMNTEIKEELGIDLFAGGEDAGRQLGEKVGFELAISCPAFQAQMMKMLGEEEGAAAETTEATAVGSATGPIKEFKTDGFVNVIMEGDGGRQIKFLWLRHFPGSEKLMGNMNQYVGKTVTITFQEIEVFLPKAGDYFKVKEITSLKVN